MSALVSALTGLFLPVKDKTSEQEHIRRIDNCTIRLYYKDTMVHQQHVCLWITKPAWYETVYGAKQNVLMKGFTGKVDDATIALLNVPHEANIGFGYYHIKPGDTLTLAGRSTGLLKITSDGY